MPATLADQIIIARQTIEEQRRKWEEEYRKDIEALDRVSRLLPTDHAPLKSNGAHPVVPAPEATPKQEIDETDMEEDDPTDEEGRYLIRAVKAVVDARPDVTFFPRRVYQTLLEQGFRFATDERRSLVTIGTSMKKLARRDPPQIRLIRHGKGRKPNLYRAVGTEPRTTAPGGQTELTM